MKAQKKLIQLSIIVSILSLAIYIIFKINVIKNYKLWYDIIQEISLALFGGSFLLIFTSFIPYFWEKTSLRKQISTAVLKMNDFYLSIYEQSTNMSFDNKVIFKTIDIISNNLLFIFNLIAELQSGAFKNLRDFNKIKIQMQSYDKELWKLKQYVSLPDSKQEVIANKITKLNKMDTELKKELWNWVNNSLYHSRKFSKSADDFVLSKSEIEHYEKND